MKNKITLVLISALLLSALTLSAQEKLIPTVQKSAYFDISKPLSEMQALDNSAVRAWKDGKVKNHFRTRKNGVIDKSSLSPQVQTTQGKRQSKGTTVNFEGTNNGDNDFNVVPPDTQGDVGPNHYVQMVNNVTEIFDKNGNSLEGPFNSSVFWSGFSGAWTGTNDGDPIVLYDEIADRWLVSQFAVETSNGTQWELIAVSTSADPTGTYFRYAFEFDDMPDYPKLGIWHDGYYMSANRFDVGSGDFNGVYACAFDRDAMLAGESGAEMIKFDVNANQDPYSILPSDCDGVFPASGTPNYFVFDMDNDTYWSSDRIAVWAFTANWTTPANSTFSQKNLITPTVFDSSFGGNDIVIDQPSTSENLSVVGDRLMFRAQYRKFATHEAIVLSRSVDVGSNRSGVRWYELRKTGLNWTLYQEGTYAPSDGNSRWMSSIAMNGSGDIALGYSVSGASTFPSIRYTGRKAGDPLGEMTITEEIIKAGTASQSGGAERWGDYSMMSVDPSDDYSFWYTTQYTSGSWNWKTRIAKFDFPYSCVPPTTQASDFSVTNIADNSMTVNWTRGNGDAVIVLASQGSAVSSVPVNEISYTANSIFGQGEELGDGNFVVYTGANSNVEITGLLPGTTYQFAVFEYFPAENCYSIIPLEGSETSSGNAPCNYCYSYGNTNYGTSITNVLFNEIDNNSLKPIDINGNAYSDYTDIATTLIRGEVYQISVNLDTDGANTIYSKVWIDWNHDCDFDDPGENYDLGTANDVINGATTNSPKSITVPSFAIIGNTTMRISARYNSAPTSCGFDFDGEVEEYTINIQLPERINSVEDAGILVGPNPTTGQVKITLPQNADIEISDVTGKVVLAQKLYSGENELNISGNAVGVYFLKVKMNNSVYGTSMILK